MVRKGPLSPADQLTILSAIWGGDDTEEGYVFLPWITGSSKTKEERRANWHESRGYEWPREKDAILDQLEAHEGDELYFSVNKFLEPSRIAQRVAESLVLYADLDEVDPRSDIDRPLQPTIAWESSPGRFQGVWLMRGMHFGACEMGGLNHRLTAMLGADPSGWDVTQVLRVPGRLNFKPEYRDDDGDPVQGELLWRRRQSYDWDEMEDRLPPVQTYGLESEIEDHEIDSVDRHAVWARVRLKVSHTVRQFMGMKTRQIEPDKHDRSEVLWQIERDLADAGCTIAEIVAVVRPTPWNKYEGRRNELSQLKAEAVKAKGVALQDADEETLEADSEDGGHKPSTPLWFTDVSMGKVQRPSWLVRNIWAKGAVGFISGQPKSYKSYLALDLALSVATGKPFLNDEQFSAVPGRVLYLQEEDSLPIVLHRAEQILEEKAPELAPKGLLTSLGGDTRERALDAPVTLSELFWSPPVAPMPLALHVRTGFTVSSWEWQSWLDEFIAEHSFDLVVIDTLGTTVGDIDTDKAGPLNDRVLKPLKVIAEQNGCAIAVVHHNRKPNDSGKARSGQQMLGSVALHAWVESALYVQAKDTLNHGLYEIKIERENKLAEDFKFRTRIKQMWVERLGNEGRRQLWEPEVLPGWGDVENEGEQKAVREVKRVTGQGGSRLAASVAQQGKGGKALMLSEVARLTGNTENQCMSQIKRGLVDGNWEETEDGTFIALTI